MTTFRSSRFIGEWKDHANSKLEEYVINTLVGTWDNVGSDLTLPTNGLTITAGGLTITAGSSCIKADTTLNCGADLIFTGTTGQGQILLTDNLADSLSMLISGGSDFLVFKTTNCSEVLSSAVDNKLTGGNMMMTKRTVTTDNTAGANTWTIAELLGGLLLRDASGCAQSDVTPTAAAIVAGIPCATIDDTFEVTIVNTGGEALTLTAGCGVTMVPAAQVMAANEQHHLIVRLTNVTGSCEAVTFYGAISAGT